MVERPDAIWSYHLSPFTCGVAKWNHLLARRLGIPCVALGTPCQLPLISIKPEEMPQGTILPAPIIFDLLLHSASFLDAVFGAHRVFAADAVLGARRVFAADAVIATALRPFRPDIRPIWCPSTIEGTPLFSGEVNVLLFGMAHKIHVHTVYVERLRDVLARAGVSYTVSVSTGVHEGQPWDEVFTRTVRNLRLVFGGHLRVLGYLGDDALLDAFRTCSAVALFFDPAARANNTTIWAAMEAGAPLITNLDRDSPPELVHGDTVFALGRMTSWPDSPALQAVASRGQQAVAGRSWEKLLEALAS